MTDTANLGLPFIEAAQAQKHVTHNEALRVLDALVMLSVKDRDLSAPPTSPEEGQRYLVKAPGSGAFAGKDDHVAHFSDGGWTFYPPHAGWTCYVEDESALLTWDGAAWVAAIDVLGGATELQNLTRLGIGTAADETNPLSAKLNNVLWTARNVAEGGNGTLRHTMSKESAADTLSLLFQDNFSGRAEIGLTGDDDFHVKVSPDGETWADALSFERTSGAAKLHAGLFLAGGLTPPQIVANQNDYDPAGLAGASILRLTSDFARQLTGLSGGADGRVIVIHNVGSDDIALVNESALSSAQNRFATGADIAMPANSGVTLRYDGASLRWRTVAGSGGGSGTGGGWTNQDRRNALIDRIQQSRLLGDIRRGIREFATGFKAATDALRGIDGGSSSNVDTSAAVAEGYVGAESTATKTGTWGTAATSSRAMGLSANADHGGVQFTAPETGAIGTVKLHSAIVNTAGSYTVRLYSNNAGNPGTQIGTDSDAVNVSATGDVTWTFSSPPSVAAGTVYWMVIVNSGPADINFDIVGPNAGYGSGRDDTITSITTTGLPSSDDWRMEIAYTAVFDNATIVTVAQTADASVSNARALIEYDPVDSITLNTDLTVEVTCDGGSNWASANLSAAGTVQGRSIAEIGDTACTAGTSFAARIKTLNSKNVRLYGATVTVH